MGTVPATNRLWLAALMTADGEEHGLDLSTLVVEIAEVNTVGIDRFGNESTPLWMAARAVRAGQIRGYELSEFLLRKGAKPSEVGEHEYGGTCTPLWFAAQAVRYGVQNGLELAKLLVENGAEVDAIGEDQYGNRSTPVWFAARAVDDGKTEGLELAKLLIEKSVTDVASLQDSTEDNIAFLCSVGQCVSVNADGKDVHGKRGSPLWFATRAMIREQVNGPALVQLLRNHGACIPATETRPFDDDETDKQSSGLVLTLHEKTSTSLTVSWTEWKGGVDIADKHTLSLELPGDHTVSSAKLSSSITKYTIGKIGLNPITSYKLYVTAWNWGGELGRGPVAVFDTGDSGGYGNIIPKDGSSYSGLALIFSMLEGRPGGLKDQERIVKLLEDIRFKVVLCTNPSKEEFHERCIWAQNQTGRWASFVCVIMAHGCSGMVKLQNGVLVLRDFFQYFKADKCKIFRGKPKIFIVNACRGGNSRVMTEADGATKRDVNEVPDETRDYSGNIESDLHLFEKSLPGETDMLFAYATLDGDTAWRDEARGTWFISTLVDVIGEWRHAEHLNDMLAMVNQLVMEKMRTDVNEGQAAEIITRGWRGKLFLRDRE
mmetsp:Transcript_10961/g.17580  ORF Transcript_10961/g.17580 Transcript_10961/m.17580 type:complete len:602 (-) Transcript_10961:185-1990(-)|eukprot:CAMPEP_0198682660 /NCGR_PEP_ID=MMETSP1468-20131203/9162_1 /TAXON_ID=1461545 /ORGANISM="Mantoniella sp, Strain CCMP1436" /LENGTH=601 /DNA_ID=CAMNT_0044425869 /DNA_START=62 /DNA_END=1867 /DNA_ORIENTATION=-